jgi:Tfp pilus assembly protein PilF
MLDGPRQYAEGLQRLEAGDYAAAADFLEFASACDPRKAIYRVKLAHARFLANPKGAEKAALQELDEAFRIDPQCGEALFVSASIHHAAGRLERADALYRQASKLLPGDRRPVDAMKAVAAALAKAKG